MQSISPETARMQISKAGGEDEWEPKATSASLPGELSWSTAVLACAHPSSIPWGFFNWSWSTHLVLWTPSVLSCSVLSVTYLLAPLEEPSGCSTLALNLWQTGSKALEISWLNERLVCVNVIINSHYQKQGTS